MDNKEKTLDALRKLGFMPDLIDEDFGYRIDYEGLSLVYSPEDDESQTLHLLVPSIFDITPENREAVLEAMVKLSSKVKYVQPNIMFDDQVWLSYQHYLGDNEINEHLLEHMIRVLSYATTHFHRIISEEGNGD